MRRGVLVLSVALLLGPASALAQTVAGQQAPVTLGVDVFSTLNPRPPSSMITQPQRLVPGEPVAPAGGERPIGYQAGNIIIYPVVTGGAFYDDNVFARNTNREGDWAGFVRPEIGWRSNNWTNAQMAGAAFVEKRWYQKFTSEDQLNAGATVGGTVQPDANTQLVGRMQYLHAHEDRGASDTINTAFARPLQYDQFEAAGAVNKRYDRFWTSLGAAAAWINFQDPTFAGVSINQDYRNGVIGRVPFRFGYVVAPNTSVFMEVSGNRRDFKADPFDSYGYRVVGGALFEPGPGSRIRGEVFGGYMFQDYSGTGFQTVSTWTIGSALAFLLMPNLTAVLESRRDAKEASLSGGVVAGDGVSVVETLVAGRIDYAVAPNVVIGGGVAYLVDEYKGANRTDRSWSPLAAARWFVNPRLTLGFDYRYLGFDSSGLGVVGYYRNVYLFSANVKL